MIRLLLLLASVFCFLIALLIAVGTFAGDGAAWLAGGLFAFVLEHALSAWLVLEPPRRGP